VTVPPQGTGQPAARGTVVPPGRYHRVERGQTLWKIARLYGLELQELLDANAISDSSKVSSGQLLRIPGNPAAASLRPSAVQLPEDEEFIWPVRGRLLPVAGDQTSDPRKGVAIVPAGRDVVVASRSGKVVFYSDDFLDLGKTLILEHADGFWTVYGRNAEVFVKVGDVVPRGTAIARAGRAGRDPATYLYFEIRKGHVPQNPNFYLPR
jgi:septal ring factor EnvC (AmiA/AmiB activator)